MQCRHIVTFSSRPSPFISTAHLHSPHLVSEPRRGCAGHQRRLRLPLCAASQRLQWLSSNALRRRRMRRAAAGTRARARRNLSYTRAAAALGARQGHRYGAVTAARPKMQAWGCCPCAPLNQADERRALPARCRRQIYSRRRTPAARPLLRRTAPLPLPRCRSRRRASKPFLACVTNPKPLYCIDQPQGFFTALQQSLVLKLMEG